MLILQIFFFIFFYRTNRNRRKWNSWIFPKIVFRSFSVLREGRKKNWMAWNGNGAKQERRKKKIQFQKLRKKKSWFDGRDHFRDLYTKKELKRRVKSERWGRNTPPDGGCFPPVLSRRLVNLFAIFYRKVLTDDIATCVMRRRLGGWKT